MINPPGLLLPTHNVEGKPRATLLSTSDKLGRDTRTARDISWKEPTWKGSVVYLKCEQLIPVLNRRVYQCLPCDKAKFQMHHTEKSTQARVFSDMTGVWNICHQPYHLHAAQSFNRLLESNTVICGKKVISDTKGHVTSQGNVL